VLISQPKLAEVKSGMALSRALAGIAITTEAISATLQSNDTLDIASSFMARLKSSACRMFIWSPRDITPAPKIGCLSEVWRIGLRRVCGESSESLVRVFGANILGPRT
jgi:hypothetical protein